MNKFSQKHYIEIASVIRTNLNLFTTDGILALVSHFEFDSPKFDRRKFLKACGVDIS